MTAIKHANSRAEVMPSCSSIPSRAVSLCRYDQKAKQTAVVGIVQKKSDELCAFSFSGVQTVDGPRWYVAHTQPHGETRAIANLERQDFHVFCPCTAKTVRHARKLTRGMAPLFPSYLFVHLDVSRDRWRSINGTRGVARLISYGEMPIPVPRGVIEDLQARTDLQGVVSWLPNLKLGQTVRISDGPFADFVGTLEMLDDLGRVRVLLEMMGRSVSVALQGKALAPVV